MSNTGKTILVTGATGQQGGVTTRHLLARGFSVRALVRDAGAPAARSLTRIGAQLVVGDMDDPASLRNAMRGAFGVFSVQPARIPPTFAEHELERGINVVEAARASGIEHFVYSSVAGADQRTGIPHWETKGQIEQRIQAADIPFTILRPTLFMDMYADASYGLTGPLSLVRTLPANAIIQHIAIDDLAEFAALAFGDPSYAGKTLELAGDELTIDQVLAAIGHATQRDLRGLNRSGLDTDADAQRVRYAGWHADIRSLRALHPGLMTFDRWLSNGAATKIELMLAHTRSSRHA